MSHLDQLADQPPDDHRPNTWHTDIEHGLCYAIQGDQETTRELENGRDEHKDREDRFEEDNGFLNYDESRGTGRRGRSSSPRQPPRRYQTQDDRTRFRDQSRSWENSRRRRNLEPRRDRDTQRGRHGFSDQWRPPGTPNRPYNTGYTIIDHGSRREFDCGQEYFMKPEVLQDVSGRYGPGDVVSIRHSDFSYDNQAEIEPQFTLSSGERLYIKKDVPLILFKVEPGYGIGWLGRSASSRGLKGIHWIPESDYPKYIGVATQGDRAGPDGNDSPHSQLQVVPAAGSECLYPTTHVFVGELVKVPIPRVHKHWGRLTPDSFYRLLCLMNFLTAGPISPQASPDSIPDNIGLDIGALRTLSSGKDSLVGDWAERLAIYAASHPSHPGTASTESHANQSQAQAPPPTQAEVRPQLQEPSTEPRFPPTVQSAPTVLNSKNSSPVAGSNRATNKVGQRPAAPNTSSQRAAQAPTVPGAAAREEARPHLQPDIRQDHIFGASAKGGMVSMVGSTRDIDAGVYNASVHNEQHNVTRVGRATSRGYEDGETTE